MASFIQGITSSISSILPFRAKTVMDTEGKKDPNFEEHGLSTRGAELWQEGGMREMLDGVFNNPYDPDTNPDGFINIGVAENYLMLEEVANFANKHIHLKGTNIDYAEGPWGRTAMRKEMSRFLTTHFNSATPIKPHELLFASGCTSLFEMLGFAIANAEDGILVGRPMYQAFKSDFGIRAKMRVVPVGFEGVDPFSLEGVKAYEEEFVAQQKAGKKIRALLLCSPHNPLGRCYAPDVLLAYMDLCQRLKIHLISDEVYALSVYTLPATSADNSADRQTERVDADDSTTDSQKAQKGQGKTLGFTSVLSLDWEKHIDKAYLHVLYGFSKDFASGGLRLGVIWTRNMVLQRALSAMSLTNWPGNLDESVGIAMLRYEEGKWIDGFHERARQKLGHGSKVLRDLLNEAEIPFEHNANAGFFLWLDLRKWLPAGEEKEPLPGPSGEQNANVSSGGSAQNWEAERELSKRMLDGGVFLTPGEQMFAEGPGFFRVCFVKPEGEIKEGMRRLRKILEESKSA